MSEWQICVSMLMAFVLGGTVGLFFVDWRREKSVREFEQRRAQRPPFRNPGEGYQPIDTGKRPARPPRER